MEATAKATTTEAGVGAEPSPLLSKRTTCGVRSSSTAAEAQPAARRVTPTTAAEAEAVGEGVIGGQRRAGKQRGEAKAEATGSNAEAEAVEAAAP